MEDITDLPVLSSGKLCWEKRHVPPKGKPGHNYWCPARVMVVLNNRTKINSKHKNIRYQSNSLCC